ncbi:hypothetical protein CAPTEDRAFT_229333 [Capitella teleta]|uniref:Uncharacterized protein n=1 Tax=Capitella teleta TaxID=283909 RepID=R7VM29_CAPTE|nr:hypothetical protein CAPTEDRAFT_229333 [Capitella teleta]|eukprot:ELU18781.1 hypothetical protein CAPTEDRAFT_229333 [Capitella teleta]
MVVTDLPFDVSAKMEARYSMLLKPGQKLEQTPEEDPRGVPEMKSSQEYAKFLRDRERKCGPDGFVDSTRYRYPFVVKKGELTESAPDLRGAVGRPVRTVVDLSAKKENNQKEYEKRLKTIEDHMWQHKQEERELKRVEGDIIKNQRTVRRTLRDYENVMKHESGMRRWKSKSQDIGPDVIFASTKAGYPTIESLRCAKVVNLFYKHGVVVKLPNAASHALPLLATGSAEVQQRSESGCDLWPEESCHEIRSRMKSAPSALLESMPVPCPSPVESEVVNDLRFKCFKNCRNSAKVEKSTSTQNPKQADWMLHELKRKLTQRFSSSCTERSKPSSTPPVPHKPHTPQPPSPPLPRSSHPTPSPHPPTSAIPRLTRNQRPVTSKHITPSGKSLMEKVCQFSEKEGFEMPRPVTAVYFSKRLECAASDSSIESINPMDALLPAQHSAHHFSSVIRNQEAQTDLDPMNSALSPKDHNRFIRQLTLSSSITRKRLAEEKKLNQGLEKYTRLQNVHTHKKEEITRARLENNVTTEQAHKDQGRKVQLTTSELAHHYRTKLSEMDLKRIEAGRLHEEFEAKLRKKEMTVFCLNQILIHFYHFVCFGIRSNIAHKYRAKFEQLEIVRSQAMNLNRDYETRLRKKEEEQFRLKQELAELAIALNMESQKGRQQEDHHRKDRKREQHVRLNDDNKMTNGLENKLAKSDGDNKAAEAAKRKLSADLMLTKAHLQLKNREEIRHKQDIVSRLKNNGSEQKQLNDVALHAELDLKSKLIDQRIQEHNKRRQGIATTAMVTRKEKSERHETHYGLKATKRKAEQQRREHEDHLKHFSKEVTKGEEAEYALYNKVKNAEYARQKQEQSVRRLSNKLLEMKRVNAVKIKEEMTERTKEEQEMHQRLQREQAMLNKMHTQREERYLVLQKHREKLRMDKYLLSEHEREHERLVRIGTRSEPTSATT